MKRNFRLILLLIFPAFTAFSTNHFTGKTNHGRFYIMPDSTLKTDPKDSASNDEDVKHRKFEFGLEGANDQTNHGAHNAKPLPYMEPSFTFTAKNGFYFEVDDQFLFVSKGAPKNRAGFDVFSVNPGWDIDFGENTTLNFNLTYNKYKQKSPNQIRSGLTWVPETYIDQYIIGELEGKLTIDYDIYMPTKKNQPKTPNDFVITPDLQYTFDWDFGKHDQNSFSFIPEVNVDFGTQNYLSVIQNNVIGDTATNSKTNYNTSSSSSFGPLDCNVIVTLELKLGGFKIEPMLNYTIPLYNEVTYNNVSLVSNKPYAYGSVTLSYTIKSKK